MNKVSFVKVTIWIAFIFCSAYFFSNPHNQSINWTFPYYSGAANFSRLFDWQISPSDFEQAKLVAIEDYRYYKHQRTYDLIPNTANNYGYVLVALTSQTLFPFLGDLQGTILLQLLVHIAAALLMMLWVLKTPLQRYGFLFLYVANPLIIYITTFPFYYFWMCFPSLAFAVLILKPEWRRWIVFVALPFLLLSLLIRPTTILLTAFFFLVAFYFAQSVSEKLLAATAAAFFIVSAFFISSITSGSPWHPMYIGIGAYDNDVGVVDLDDKRGYEYFRSHTGITIDTDAIRGNWNDPDIRQHYLDTLKNRYVQIAQENPALLVRNAIVNMLQVFSVGYIVEKPVLTWASTALGATVLGFLLLTRQFVWVFAVLASAVSFAWYFPPIPAYNFAAYLLLVLAILFGLERNRRFGLKVSRALANAMRFIFRR
jgi:hypothetical protein